MMTIATCRALLFAVMAFCSWTTQVAADPSTNSSRVNLKICPGEFALCASSTGVLTGKTITIRSFDGQMQTFPETLVTCPILKGPSIAGLNSNTMGNSCRAPKGQVFSLYGLNSPYPQEALNWQSAAPISQKCAPQPTTLKAGTFKGQSSQAISQCWSMACTKTGKLQNGVPLAACSCAFGESPVGGTITPTDSSVTDAGYGNPGACTQNPVAGALPVG